MKPFPRGDPMRDRIEKLRAAGDHSMLAALYRAALRYQPGKLGTVKRRQFH
jgi:hypothetical protein